MRERDIERYLVKRVKELGGEVRKVKWIGRRSAPDRLVMVPHSPCHGPAASLWVELKNPDTIDNFPSNAHERAQDREHQRMRRMGADVYVIGTTEQIDQMLPPDE